MSFWMKLCTQCSATREPPWDPSAVSELHSAPGYHWHAFMLLGFSLCLLSVLVAYLSQMRFHCLCEPQFVYSQLLVDI